MNDPADNEVNRALEAIRDLLRFIDVVHQGFDAAAAGPEWAARLKDSLIEATRERYRDKEFLARIEEQHRFAMAHAETGHRYLYGLAVVQLWSILEAFAEDVTKSVLREPSALRRFPVLASLEGPVVEIREASADELADMLFERLQSASKAKLKPGVAGFEQLLASVGLGGEVQVQVKRVLFEAAVVRNVVVHCRARLDARALSLCPWLGSEPGLEVPLNQVRFQSYYLASYWYISEVSRRSCFIEGRVEVGFEDYVARMDSLKHDLEEELERLLASSAMDDEARRA